MKNHSHNNNSLDKDTNNHSIKQCPFINQSFIVISNDLRVIQLSHLAKGLLRYYPSDLDKTVYLDSLLKVKKSKKSGCFLDIWAKTYSGENLALTTCLHPLNNNSTLWFLVPQSRVTSIDRSPSPIPDEVSRLLYAFNALFAMKITQHGLIRSISTDDSPLIPVYLPRIQLLPIFELIHPSDMQQFCQFISSSLKTGLPFKFKLRWICFDYNHRYNVEYVDCSVSEDGSVTRVNYDSDSNFDYELESDTTEDCSSYNSPKSLTLQNSYEIEWVQITCQPSADGGDLTLIVEPSFAPSVASFTRSPHLVIQLAGIFAQYVKGVFSLFKHVQLERITLLKALVSILGLLCQIDYFINTKEFKLWYTAPFTALQNISPSRCYEMGQINLNQLQSQRPSHNETSSFWPILGLVIQLAVFKLPHALWNRMKDWIL